MNEKQQSSVAELFGPVIHAYSRAQAIEDGYLVDVTDTAKEAAIVFPVAMTRAVWDDCVEWSDADSKRQTYQDQSGRLWDVVWMLRIAIQAMRRDGRDTVLYQLRRVPRGGRGKMARKVTLKAHVGPGDNGEPVITIMQPQED